MKKTILAVFALLAVLACSQKEMDIQTPEQEVDNTPMSFNLSVNPMNGDAETKAALKAGWSNGDVVYVFFDAIPTKYIKKSYDGSTWTDSFPGGAFVAGDFSADEPAASRYMTAVWFPKEMGGVTVSYADSKFSFTIGGEKIYSHYMSVHPSYTVSGTTISGTLNMEKPTGFVQFFVPGIAAADAPTYRLMESHLTPKACDYVALAGGVAESARTAGYSIKGTAFTSDESVAGALFGGFLSSNGMETNYSFSLVKEISVEKPAAVGTYTLSGTKTINEGNSMTFPAIGNAAWGTMSPFVSMGYDGGPLWATGNLDKTNGTIVGPLAAGEYFMYGKTTPYSASESNYTGTEDPLDTSADVAYSVNTAWRIPTKAQFDALFDASSTTTVWETGWTTLGGDDNGGRLITSNVNGISLFFAGAGYYDGDGTLSEAGNFGFCWSSTPFPYDSNDAYGLLFYSFDSYRDHYFRYFGFSVRPVKAAAAPAPSAPTGAIDGLFSVSSTKQVYFSQGNLQAIGTTSSSPSSGWTWQFAEHQWDYIGGLSSSSGSEAQTGNNYISDNGTVSSNGTVDLFCWSTNATYYGIHNSYDNNDYSGDFRDWGNTMSGDWRTLTYAEWGYLFNTRTTTSGVRYAKAKVNNVNGVILLPDDWSTSYHALSSTDTGNAAFTANEIDASTWASSLEVHGAVFLPAAGCRYIDGENNNYATATELAGFYWSSVRYDDGYYNDKAYNFFFNPELVEASYSTKNGGCSVRLVKDAN